jgi:hypothetical protein
MVSSFRNTGVISNNNAEIQSASANMIGGFDCYGEWRCVSGWNHAISQAQTDWNSQAFTVDSGGNNACYGHTNAYCNGYQAGYNYQWSTWAYDYHHGLYPFNIIQGQENNQNTKCVINDSPGATCIQGQQSQQAQNND